MHITQFKNQLYQLDKATRYMFPIKWHHGKDKTEDGKIYSLSPEKLWIGKAQRIFEDSETALPDSIEVDVCQYIFVEAHKLYSISCEAFYRLLIFDIMSCQCSIISCNIHSTLLWDFSSGRAVRSRGSTETLCFLFSFSLNLLIFFAHIFVNLQLSKYHALKKE